MSFMIVRQDCRKIARKYSLKKHFIGKIRHSDHGWLWSMLCFA